MTTEASGAWVRGMTAAFDALWEAEESNIRDVIRNVFIEGAGEQWRKDRLAPLPGTEESKTDDKAWMLTNMVPYGLLTPDEQDALRAEWNGKGPSDGSNINYMNVATREAWPVSPMWGCGSVYRLAPLPEPAPAPVATGRAINFINCDIAAEVARATEKFQTWPSDPVHAAAVLAEECGEVQKAALQAVYEPHKSGPSQVRVEAVQAAAMCVRFLASFDCDKYEWTPAKQHVQECVGVMVKEVK